MRLLVTGGTGFLGSHLVPALVAAGHRVRLISRTAPAALPEGAEHVPGDLKDREAVRRALREIEVVFHLAGLVSFDPRDGRRMYELHVDCTRELLRDASAAGVKRFILASTSGTIAVSKEERIATERDDYPVTVVGRWPYYLSKIYEEKLALEHCRQHGLPLVVANPSLLMGPGDDRLSSTWTVVKFLNRDIPGMPNGGISFADARDVAAALVSALERGEVGGRHLMGVNMTMKEYFERLSRLTGVAPPSLRLPRQGNLWGARLLEKIAQVRGVEPALDRHSVDIGEHWFWLDASKAERELGFRARDPHETLHDTVQFILRKMPPEALPGVKGELFESRRER